MTWLVIFVLQLFSAPNHVQSAACRALGGHPMWEGSICYQTLAACYDENGWSVTCPGSVHCSPPRLECL